MTRTLPSPQLLEVGDVKHGVVLVEEDAAQPNRTVDHAQRVLYVDVSQLKQRPTWEGYKQLPTWVGYNGQLGRVTSNCQLGMGTSSCQLGRGTSSCQLGRGVQWPTWEGYKSNCGGFPVRAVLQAGPVSRLYLDRPLKLCFDKLLLRQLQQVVHALHVGTYVCDPRGLCLARL